MILWTKAVSGDLECSVLRCNRPSVCSLLTYFHSQCLYHHLIYQIGYY